jgi:hypothetical protein
MFRPHAVHIVALGAAALAGCGPDRRMAELSETVVTQQSQQNIRALETTSEVSLGTRQLIQLQQQLRQDLAEIGKQRSSLDAERRELAAARRSDSLLAASLLQASTLLTSLAPLVLVSVALFALWRSPTQEELGSILVEHLTRLQAAGDPQRRPLPAPQPRGVLIRN